MAGHGVKGATFLGILLLGAGCASSSAGPEDVDMGEAVPVAGRVQDDQLLPVSGANVSILTRTDLVLVAAQTTAEDGSFRFEAVPRGITRSPSARLGTIQSLGS